MKDYQPNTYGLSAIEFMDLSHQLSKDHPNVLDFIPICLGEVISEFDFDVLKGVVATLNGNGFLRIIYGTYLVQQSGVPGGKAFVAMQPLSFLAACEPRILEIAFRQRVEKRFGDIASGKARQELEQRMRMIQVRP